MRSIRKKHTSRSDFVNTISAANPQCFSPSLSHQEPGDGRDGISSGIALEGHPVSLGHTPSPAALQHIGMLLMPAPAQSVLEVFDASQSHLQGLAEHSQLKTDL